VIVVDTNVIPELMRGEPHLAVRAWVAAQSRPLLYTTHINQAESSMALTPCPRDGGARRWRQRQGAMFAEDFAGPILPFEAGRPRIQARGGHHQYLARSTPAIRAATSTAP